jgi:hypothetical protein
MKTAKQDITYTTICPNCNHEFNDDKERTKRAFEAARKELKEQNDKAIAIQKTLEEKDKKREEEYNSQLLKATQEEKEKLNKKNNEHLAKELLRLKNEAKEQSKEDHEKEKQIMKTEHELELKEKDILLSQQLAAAEKQRQQLTQGSMQLQGEALEQVVKENLEKTYPGDTIEDIVNGSNGADMIQKVYFQNTNVGSILIECKNTKSFATGWIAKLKDEMRELGVEATILISRADAPQKVFIEARKRGIVICNPETYSFAIPFLREALYKTHILKKNNFNQKSKGEEIIQYLSGQEFGHNFRALVDLYHEAQTRNKKAHDWMNRYFNVQQKDSEKLSQLLSNTFHGLQRASGESIPEIPGLEYTLEFNDIEGV